MNVSKGGIRMIQELFEILEDLRKFIEGDENES